MTHLAKIAEGREGHNSTFRYMVNSERDYQF